MTEDAKFALEERIQQGSLHREEMNIIEHPTAIVSDRVPINPATGKEFTEIRYEQTITENGTRLKKQWVVSGDEKRGGLPRGFDMDVMTALMSEWSRSGFHGKLISLRSVYSILKLANRDPNKREYQRFRKALDRYYGLSIDTRHAIYNPTQGRRVEEKSFRLFQSYRIESEERGKRHVLCGYVQVSDEFHNIVKTGYVKFTDTNRYWRLPTSYTRRLFQYLDKQKQIAVRKNYGKWHINGYLLLRKLGSLQETVEKYSPAKIRNLLGQHLDALVSDGYLAGYTWKHRGRAKIVLHIAYSDKSEKAELSSKREKEVAEYIAEELGEPEYDLQHQSYIRQIGIEQALDYLEIALDRTSSGGNAAAYYTQLVKNNEPSEQGELFD